jgi:DNA-binding YbaB/EbfC family protein
MKLKKIQNLMKQAQQMQEDLANKMEEMSFKKSVGGGVVEIEMNGAKKVLSVKIDPDVVDPDDVEMLQDLIVAAVNETAAEVDAQVSSQVAGLTGGLF